MTTGGRTIRQWREDGQESKKKNVGAHRRVVWKNYVIQHMVLFLLFVSIVANVLEQGCFFLARVVLGKRENER